jgi:hypothetical protein
MMEDKKIKYYAGIGSRETPPGIEPIIEEVVKILDKFGYILRSGGADGSDSMFEKYSTGDKEIYLPWKGFNKNNSELYLDNMDPLIVERAQEIAREHHPSWKYLSDGGRKLMTRNTFQVLGKDLETPSSFIVCWTPGGKMLGGTAQALRIAKKMGIPIFNLYDKNSLHKIKLLVNNI